MNLASGASAPITDDGRKTSIMYVWPARLLAPGVLARIAVHMTDLTPTRDTQSQVVLRVKLVAEKLVKDSEAAPAAPETSASWCILHPSEFAVDLDIITGPGKDTEDDTNVSKVKQLLDAQGLGLIIANLKEQNQEPNQRLDAFVVFYEALDAPDRKLLAESPSDVANVVKDAVRSADVAFFPHTNALYDAPDLQAVLTRLGAFKST